MGMMGTGNHNEPNSPYQVGQTLSEINVTPMVDVMLVLLIIFMVAAPLMQQGVQVDLPQNKAPALDDQEEQLILTIQADSRIFLKESELDAGMLAKQLAAIFEHKAKKEIYVHADKSVSYGLVANVMADIKNAGIEKVGLVTEPVKPNP